MPFKTIDRDKLHHLAELAELEKLFFNQFNVEGFLDALLVFVTNNFNMESDDPPTKEELIAVDGFVKNWLDKRLSDTERWLVRGFVVGKLLEMAEHGEAEFVIDVEKLPVDIHASAKAYNLAPQEVHMLEWAKAHGGENIKNVSESTSKIVRRNLMETIEHRGGYRYFQNKMENEILDNDGEINKNFRRIAITEINSAYNNAYLLQLKDGDWVMGFSLPDACPVCLRLIDGKVYMKIDNAPKKGYENLDHRSNDYKFAAWKWENAVWVGKDKESYGRSASPNKRVKGELVEREHHERVMPAIPLHPHCLRANAQITMGDWTAKNISEVRAGDEVITHLGRPRRVLATSKRTYDGDFVKLTTTDGKTVEATAEHPLMCYNLRGSWYQKPISGFGLNRSGLLSLIFGRTREGGIRFDVIKNQLVYQDKCEVYNIEVEEDNTYIFDGVISHNCRCRWIRIDTATFYVEANEMKVRYTNEEAWQNWFKKEVAETIKQYDKFREATE